MASPELHALFAHPLAARKLSAETVVHKVTMLVASMSQRLAEVRKAKGLENVSSEALEAQRKKWCQAALQEAVQGDTKTPLMMLSTCSFGGGLLCVLVMALLWCEDYPSGARFRQRLFPDEEREEQQRAAAATKRRE